MGIVIHPLGGAANSGGDTALINDALAFAETNGHAEVKIVPPAAAIVPNDTLRVGQGITFRSVSLVGDATSGPTGTGVRLSPTFTDRPVINVQGGRNNKVKGLYILGVINDHMVNAVNHWRTPSPSDWLPPTLPNGLSRYSPYAAITIDAFSGLAPPNPYTGTYGKPFSSNTTIEDVFIYGFAVGAALQPCDADGNCDFTRFINCQFGNGIYGIAVCNSQSRNVSIEDCEYVRLHTFLTTGHFGRQNGQVGAVVRNLSGGAGYQLLDMVNLGSSGSVIFDSLYFEGQTRLGRWGGGGSFNYPLIFRGGTMNFNELMTGISPRSALEIGGSLTSVIFQQVTFHGHRRMLNLCDSIGNATIEIDDCRGVGMSGFLSPNPNPSPAIARGLSYFGGLFAGLTSREQGTLILKGNSRAWSWDEGTLTRRSKWIGECVDRQIPRQQVHHGAQRFIDGQGTQYCIKQSRVKQPLPIGHTGYFVTPIAVSGDLISFRYHKVRQESQAAVTAIEPGDILYFQNCATICIVTEIARNPDTHYDVTAQVMNNCTYDAAGAATPCLDLSLETGYIYLHHTGQHVGTMLWYGDFVAGNYVVANVRAGNGAASNLSTFVKPGDMLGILLAPDAAMGIPYPANTKIIDVADGPVVGAVTLSHAATMTKRFPVCPVLFN